MKLLFPIISVAVFACTSTSETPWQRLGIAELVTTESNTNRVTELVGRDATSLGSITLDTRRGLPSQVAQIAWRGETYDVTWSTDTLDIRIDGDLELHATAASLDASDGLVVDDRRFAGITIAGLVARENGFDAAWWPESTSASLADVIETVEEGEGAAVAWEGDTAVALVAAPEDGGLCGYNTCKGCIGNICVYNGTLPYCACYSYWCCGN